MTNAEIVDRLRQEVVSMLKAIVLRVYVSYRNGFIPSSEFSRADQVDARRTAQNYFDNLTANDVRQFLADARAQALEQI